jgi:uncharacterized membrane protein
MSDRHTPCACRGPLGAWLPLLFALTLVLPASGVDAQSSGGSFGGGSFEGGGGGGGGGGYTPSPSYQPSGGGDYGGGYQGGYQGGGYDGNYQGGSGDGCSSLFCCFFLFMLIAVVLLISRFRHGDQVRGTLPVTGGIDVSGLMLAIDWRARKHIQGQLEQLAKTGDTSTPDGLARMARETALALRREELSWLYGSVLNALPACAPGRRAGVSSRGRRRAQQVPLRTHPQRRRQHAGDRGPEQRVSREEGEGVVVVTLLVAAHRELIDVADVTNANEVRHLLDQVIALDGNSIAVLEVIWSPADENDRMSTAELEMLYPGLRRINEQTVAGRVFCAYCAAPFAKELQTCPHCGAPAGDAKPRG